MLFNRKDKNDGDERLELALSKKAMQSLSAILVTHLSTYETKKNELLMDLHNVRLTSPDVLNIGSKINSLGADIAFIESIIMIIGKNLLDMDMQSDNQKNTMRLNHLQFQMVIEVTKEQMKKALVRVEQQSRILSAPMTDDEYAAYSSELKLITQLLQDTLLLYKDIERQY
jgi:hypothetical protein